MARKKKTTNPNPALAAGATLGGPPAGASLGNPPTGSSLGGPPVGASLGNPPTGSSLGGPPPGASLGNPPTGSSLGGPPVGASLGNPPTGSSIGGPPVGAALGGPPVGASLGNPPTGSSIGGPPVGAALGGPPVGAALGVPTALGAPTALGLPPGSSIGVPTSLGTEVANTGASTSNKKKRKKKKKTAQEATPPPAAEKKPKISKIAARIKKQQEEEEQRRLEEERLQKEEDERLEREAKEKEEEKEKQKEKRKQKRAKRDANAKTKQQQIQIQRLKAAGFKLPPALQKLDDELNGIQSNDTDETEESKEIKHQRKVESAKIKKAQEKKREAEKAEEEDEEEDDDWDAMYDSDGEQDTTPKSEEKPKKQEEEQEIVSINEGEMRSPICCVLGHVDTGKTLLLDKIRRSNVQKGEAGGITQQIGATYFPLDTIKKLTSVLGDAIAQLQFMVPGLLIIDTPGHESFTNLRTRGSSLCDIAVLVVDINHGIEQQTEESMKLLRKRKTPFIVALNKIDRIFEWVPHKDASIRTSLENQPKHVVKQYNEMVDQTITSFSQRGFNSVLYYKNKDFRNNVSIVPTSAVTGEGIPDLLMLLIQLTQKMMTNQLYLSPELKCTVLEIKMIEGLGMTCDVIVSDGILEEGDTLVLCGVHGPIVTNIRALLTPPPLREIRVKAGKGHPYVHAKSIKAAMGVKIVAHDLQDVVAGSQLLVCREGDDLEALKEEVQRDLKKLQSSVKTTDRGVFVQASTLGSLEALLSFLRDSKIPVSAVGIGPVHKRDVTRASVMLEHDKKYAAILAFDVKIEKDAQRIAEKLGVKIFSAPIIYHLNDMFVAYLKEIEDEKRRIHAGEAVWPVVMEIMPEHIFNKKDPLVFGVTIVEGTLRIHTPISAIKDGENLYLGKVTSIEDNRVAVTEAAAGAKVAIKISPEDYAYAYERHFTHEHPLMSRITRHSLDRLKEFFRKELTKKDVRLLKDMKTIFNVED